jgi:uncharacterized protein YecE (DUF72 family)
MAFDREQIKKKAAALAASGVFIGTSSWKYEGWRGMLYDEQRYITRGKVSEKRFEKNCLSEYAEVFKTVCVDGMYYKFPDEKYLTGLVEQVPTDFQFAFKVTDAITIKKYANLPKFGARAGKPNEHFLDADLFERAFLKPCEPFRKNIGLLMFEFSRFYPSDYEHASDFVADLDKFLGALSTGWPYAVELRNKDWLQPDYFQCLARHSVAHVFNSWQAMPPVSEQIAIPGSQTNPSLTAARFLLVPGRKYEVAVKIFEGYKMVKERNDDARAAGAKLIADGKAEAGKKKTMIYVNNRLEGNALETIDAMLERVTAQESAGTSNS